MEKLIHYMPDAVGGGGEDVRNTRPISELLRVAPGYDSTIKGYRRAANDFRKSWYKNADERGFLPEPDAATILIDMGLVASPEEGQQTLMLSSIPAGGTDPDNPNFLPYKRREGLKLAITPAAKSDQAGYRLVLHDCRIGFPG